MNFKVFILAGGFGTRLSSVIKGIPKPMAPINNKPFLDYKINGIRKYYPNCEIYLLTHHLSDYIEEYYKNEKHINIIKEPIALGTGGSIKNAISVLGLNNTDKLLISNGDTHIQPDYKALVNSGIEDVVMLAAYQEYCDRYETLEIKNNMIISFSNRVAGKRNSYINGGCYFFNNLSFFGEINENKFSIEDKFRLYKNKNIKAFMYNDIFIDIGIPEDYKLMENYIKKNEK